MTSVDTLPCSECERAATGEDGGEGAGCALVVGRRLLCLGVYGETRGLRCGCRAVLVRAGVQLAGVVPAGVCLARLPDQGLPGPEVLCTHRVECSETWGHRCTGSSLAFLHLRSAPDMPRASARETGSQ